MPEDPMYLPLHVGAEGSGDIGYRRDDEGDNISGLNPLFSELTGLYWGWKHLDADYIGLVHYRRHFSMRRIGRSAMDKVLTEKELSPFLGRIRLFTPVKRKYYIETLYSHYVHTHFGWQLDLTRRIISDKYPEYLESYDKAMKRTWGYMFNMFIAARDCLDSYCSWLFDILFELKERTDKEKEKELSPFQMRYYGRVSEIIFNAWILQKLKEGYLKESEIMEIPVIYTERVNFLKKANAFMRAKVLGIRYEKSF